MNAFVINLQIARERRLVRWQLYRSLDDLPDVTEAGQAAVRAFIYRDYERERTTGMRQPEWNSSNDWRASMQPSSRLERMAVVTKSVRDAVHGARRSL